MLDETLFEQIAQDVERQVYSIHSRALPKLLSRTLFVHQQTMDVGRFKPAGIGRGADYLETELVRTDKICWITGDTAAGQMCLDWTARLQHYLNRRLFLGLFSFESPFAHFKPGDYYKRHYDFFHGESNRIISVLAYFNDDWKISNGGELILYANDHDKEGAKVAPLPGTVVTFLSEEFPHEVLSVNRDRYSIAGWF
jgi:SM-20-related protein